MVESQGPGAKPTRATSPGAKSAGGKLAGSKPKGQRPGSPANAASLAAAARLEAERHPGLMARTAAAAILLVAATAALLTLMGRPPIGTCGSIDLWVGQVNSSRTSQMLSDWYSPSRIVHGFLFYAALALVARKWPIERRFVAALTIEAAWEIVENTPMIINRYREATAALGYTGDSVLNSLSDIAMMGLGFLLTDSQYNGRVDRMFLAIILLALLGTLTDFVLNAAQRVLLRRWR